jgi:AAA family ATP:ADP antiporter
MTAFLQRFTNIRREEVAGVLAASLFFFFILTALMVVRPARESIGMRTGLDEVRWLFVGTAVVTLLVNPVFGWLVSRFRRLLFITATYLFFAASLVVFYGLIVLAPEAVGEVSGRVFYVWFSVFNLFVTMVFWALMADRFSLDQSKRFFAFIAAGGTLGAIFGPFLATQLAEPLGTPALILVAVAFLCLAVGAAWLVASLQPERAAPGTAPGVEAPPAVDERAIIGGSAWQGFRAVSRSPYLLGITGYVVVIAIVGTFLYFTRLAMVAERAGGIDEQTTLFAQIDLFTQSATLLLQLIVAGHLMRRLGVAVTLAILPVIVVLGMVGLVIVGSLAALVLFEAAYRAVQRAVMRPARETLFTVVSREDKYKSKSVIDTFGMRGGDVVGAGADGVLAGLGAGFVAMASVTIPLAAAWAALGVWLGRAQGRIVSDRGVRGGGRDAPPGLAGEASAD